LYKSVRVIGSAASIEKSIEIYITNVTKCEKRLTHSLKVWAW